LFPEPGAKNGHGDQEKDDHGLDCAAGGADAVGPGVEVVVEQDESVPDRIEVHPLKPVCHEEKAEQDGDSGADQFESEPGRSKDRETADTGESEAAKECGAGAGSDDPVVDRLDRPVERLEIVRKRRPQDERQKEGGTESTPDPGRDAQEVDGSQKRCGKVSVRHDDLHRNVLDGYVRECKVGSRIPSWSVYVEKGRCARLRPEPDGILCATTGTERDKMCHERPMMGRAICARRAVRHTVAWCIMVRIRIPWGVTYHRCEGRRGTRETTGGRIVGVRLTGAPAAANFGQKVS